MACGVPIIGYANDAWRPLAGVSEAGWAVPNSEPEVMANKIAQLDRSEYDIENAARHALHFAEDHTFDKTFRRRIDHLKGIAARYAIDPIAKQQ